jgi:hypothetical protein
MTTKTQEQLQDLKMQWCADPCWDIESTEGFEEYHDELLEYSELMIKQWDEYRQTELIRFAKSRGLESNLQLASYIRMLEQRIYSLEKAAQNA